MKNQALFASLLIVATGACGGGNEAQQGGADAAGTSHADAGPTGGNADAAPTGGNPDATPIVTGDDHGAPSDTYPAYAPVPTTIINNGGPVLANPVIVTVSWTADSNMATYEAFGDNIGATDYWHQINSEYGVGPAVSGPTNHVELSTAPPATLSDRGVQTLIENGLADATAPWPAPVPGTIYIVYMASATTLTMQGQDVCQLGIGGWHDEDSVNGVNFSYAVIPQCSNNLDDAISAASHELNEAVTDPFPFSNPAWVGFDDGSLSWEFFNALQDETGDACEIYRSAYYQDTEANFDYYVQRQWSNQSFAEGHNPCVPVPPGPFYNVTTFPGDLETITVDLGPLGYGTYPSKGFVGVLNQPRTFQVGFFSDAPTSSAWTLEAIVESPLEVTDQQGNPLTNGTASIVIDKTSGVNGEKAYVTVTPTSWGSTGTVYFYLKSSIDRSGHYLPIIFSKQ